MTRPLTGQREVFRRLQENQEARRRRTNEVRQMGGLEPLPEPEEGRDNRIYWYQQHIAERLNAAVHAAGYRMWIDTYADRPNRNGEVFTREALQEAFDRLRDDRPQPTYITIPRDHNGFIPGIVQMVDGYTAPIGPPEPRPIDTQEEFYRIFNNPCNEITYGNMRIDTSVDLTPLNHDARVAYKKMTGEKLNNNEDFTFLLNRDD